MQTRGYRAGDRIWWRNHFAGVHHRTTKTKALKVRK